MHTTVLLGTRKFDQSAWRMASKQRFLNWSLDHGKLWEEWRTSPAWNGTARNTTVIAERHSKAEEKRKLEWETHTLRPILAGDAPNLVPGPWLCKWSILPNQNFIIHHHIQWLESRKTVLYRHLCFRWPVGLGLTILCNNTITLIGSCDSQSRDLSRTAIIVSSSWNVGKHCARWILFSTKFLAISSSSSTQSMMLVYVWIGLTREYSLLARYYLQGRKKCSNQFRKSVFVSLTATRRQLHWCSYMAH